MKLLLLAVAALIVAGGIYHKEIARSFTQGGSQSSGVVQSMGGLGDSVGSSYTNIGGALGQ